MALGTPNGRTDGRTAGGDVSVSVLFLHVRVFMPVCHVIGPVAIIRQDAGRGGCRRRPMYVMSVCSLPGANRSASNTVGKHSLDGQRIRPPGFLHPPEQRRQRTYTHFLPPAHAGEKPNDGLNPC